MFSREVNRELIHQPHHSELLDDLALNTPRLPLRVMK
jgi:hypothetical protein